MKRIFTFSLFIALPLVLTATILLIAQVPETVSTLPKPEESPLYIERYAELQPSERVAIQVYERCNRSVVNLDTQTTVNIFLFGQVDEPGAGSGIVLDKEGHILTNRHVIANVDAVKVTLFNGNSYEAKLVGSDPITDLAIIWIDAPPEALFPITFGDSSKLLVGQQIFAIGNPFGLERTLTSGLISSLNRSMPSRVPYRSIRGLIQTDAAINPGNSGGALLDTQGRLIGINTAIASRSGGSHGVGFAIPSRTILRIVPQLLKNGKVIRGEIGIDTVQRLSRDLPNGGTIHGLWVTQLAEKGPAEKAGLRVPRIIRTVRGPQRDPNTGDLITAADGVQIGKVDDFTAVIDERAPGDSVVLDVFREGSMIKVTIVLE
ncbi:MAG: trypsin-like peptidase domain-containing protein [Planctomycetaceae bacterium]|nr:trypsin-like peptidase domain-containing protein [Planctomycetaceae bacterium]